ncbi:MAG: COQ9 family protein [Parasphingorhabdus sp.]|nr:COQ9 family protein [Parasphingorhabdus sp.]
MPQSAIAADLTLEEVRAALAPKIAAQAAFDGWNEKAVRAAAMGEDIDPDIAALAFTDGAVAMIDAWFVYIDQEMAHRLPPEKLAGMKIRARIAALVETRLEILAPDREGLRRAIAILAAPPLVPKALAMGWRAADAMWRLAGDTATDFNHYSKRTLLGGVYASTLAIFLNDDSEDFAETRGFLARRIDNVMQIEKVKSKFASGPAERFSLARFVGRLRYPQS